MLVVRLQKACTAVRPARKAGHARASSFVCAASSGDAGQQRKAYTGPTEKSRAVLAELLKMGTVQELQVRRVCCIAAARVA